MIMTTTSQITRKHPARTLLWILITAITCSTLAACAPLLLGGALVGGSLMAIDRRTSGAQVEDQAIELKGGRRISEAADDRGHINLTSYNRQVLLTGEAATEADKAAIEQAVLRIENVGSVVNELMIGLPSSMSSRSNDSLLTSKVKASMVDATDVQAKVFKVVTERGIVYLMGRVSEREASRAADIARGVNGVQKVVRVFEVVSETELARPGTRSASAPTAPATTTFPTAPRAGQLK
jgi:osmotically-inducible protein OsmY